MPTYEYACTACGERTEQKARFEDPPLDVCPLCGGVLRKLYSPVGIVFKGSGFYSTDAKKGSSKTKTSSEGSKSSGSEAKSESKSGSKSEAKAAPKEKPAAEKSA
ncbi:MAG TPA: FmdB family zinc ribbon protein [Actinomycetota bacterium]|nr:FmdB family zinc ribbon protein [Actinomycetota bacterium]